MMYVQQSLTAGEELIHIGHFPWMYTVHAVMHIVFGVLGCIFVLLFCVYVREHYWGLINHAAVQFTATSTLGKIRELHPAIRLGAFLIFIFGLLKFAEMMVVKSTTEIAVTTSRLIYKRGLVARYVGEMSIDRIEGVNVLQTVGGRLFDYGRLLVRGMGVGEVILPPIADPITFRKAIEKAKTS